MENMLPPEATLIRNPIRPLKRAEYERLASEGYFANERVELLFGMVVEMSPIDPAHSEATTRLHDLLHECLKGRAIVRQQNPFAATDDSEPEPDIYVCPLGEYWHAHPDRAHLVIEVARSSLRHDRVVKKPLYAMSQVDEYWIVDHVHGVVEVYRDRVDGDWRSMTTYTRGQTLAMLAFPDVTIDVSAILPPVG